VLDLLASDQPPGAYEFDGYWLDIGRHDDYDRANAEFDQIKPLLLKGCSCPTTDTRNINTERRTACAC
jgi:NDP-sugar pyrophosphorylase family protein